MSAVWDGAGREAARGGVRGLGLGGDGGSGERYELLKLDRDEVLGATPRKLGAT
jgi:hypothetical protein